MSTLANRYANAIFELMKNETDKDKDKISNNFLEVGALYKESTELKKVLNDPTIKFNFKKDVLSEIIKISSFKPLTVKSLNFILESNRFSYIEEIANDLSKLVDTSLNRVNVTIVLARDIKKGLFSSDPLANVKKEVEAVLKGKKIVYNTEIDSSIIGGIIVRIGDKLYDFSVKNSLESIKSAIN